MLTKPSEHLLSQGQIIKKLNFELFSSRDSVKILQRDKVESLKNISIRYKREICANKCLKRKAKTKQQEKKNLYATNKEAEQ